LKKDFGTDNLLTLIYMGTMKSLWTLPKELWLETAKFEELEGRTLAELEGLGVISRFDDGNLISKFVLLLL
jgi:hypothetical protein